MTEVQIPLRAVVLREDSVWVIQCLEHDIFAFGSDFDTVVKRFEATLDAEALLAPAGADHPFAHIPAAPDYFHVLWDQQKTVLTTPVAGVEMAIAA